MAYYIIIRGPAGVGKTTIAKETAKKKRGVYFSIDEIIEEQKLEVMDIPESNFLEAQEQIIPSALQYLKEGKIVVFDGSFYFQGQINHLIKKLPFPKYIFTLKASLTTCYERNKGRKDKGKLDRISVQAVHKLVSKFDSGKVIDTENKTQKEVVKEILLDIE